VEFLGFVDAIPTLLQSADCYVQSSRWEGFGLAVAEAMAAGLPVVVSDVDSLPELVDDGRTGRVVRAGDDGLFAERILELARDPALRERLGTPARHEASRRFTVERMMDDYAALYEKALAGLAP
jgi:glycosyltransferase involved in cell wall biosynthesis